MVQRGTTLIVFSLLVLSGMTVAMSFKRGPAAENGAKINNLSPEDAQKATRVTQLTENETYSGFVETNSDSGSAMYFYFSTALDGKGKDAPIILWLQGGPGCSSWMGNMIEMGPYAIKSDPLGESYVEKREYTWNEHYNLMFVDNPLGAGYSYAAQPEDYVTSEDEMSKNLHLLLATFFTKFPQFHTNDFYVFGESYGGKYVPAISKYILFQNLTGAVKIRLRGMGIGDGWTDPIIQLVHHADFCFANGLVDEKEAGEIHDLELQGEQAIKEERYQDALDLYNTILPMMQEYSGGANIYNYRTYEPYQEFHSQYLNRAEVKQMFNVPEFITFAQCNDAATVPLEHEFMQSVKPYFPDILNSIPVMLYNGQDDLCVNTIGSEAWIRTIEWPHQGEYQQADRYIWKNEKNEIAGYVRGADNLVQVNVLKAGHMVPKDQLENSRDMVRRFIDFVAGGKNLKTAFTEE